MELANSIIGINGLVLSLASLLVMIFGINLGKNALLKGEILFGTEAEDRVKHKLPPPHSDSKIVNGKEGKNLAVKITGEQDKNRASQRTEVLSPLKSSPQTTRTSTNMR